MREDDVLGVLSANSRRQRPSNSISTYVIHGKTNHLQRPFRQAILRGVNQLAEAVKGNSRTEGRTRRSRKIQWTRASQGWCHGREVELRIAREFYGRADGARGRVKDTDVAGDGTTTATILAQAIFREGIKTFWRTNPMKASAASTKLSNLTSKKSNFQARLGDMIAQVGRFPPIAMPLSVTALPKRCRGSAKMA
jgi:hypothetical protein